MALNVGSRLGHYNVTALIGEGGMGQVYQATDTKLKRQVALKILPEAFSADPERLARFQREAEVLASLNHPNIAAIYGLEEADDTRALVLELVEGPTLADRIKRGPIPLDEALPIAKQIAEALEAAHEAGVIHRDLKPANIKVKDDGTVKVLDFGLAKALDPSPVGDPSQSPTLTAAATQMGVIMGTAAYMSPEQARGKPVDKRADIWAFGCVLYEMLTGRMAFHGEDVSLTLASVMKSDVNVKALSPDVPATVRTVLSRCLEKDTSQRIRDIGDVRLALAGAFETPAGVPAERPVVKRRAREWLPWVAGIAIGSLVAAVVLSTARESETSLPTRFTIQTPAGFEAFQPPVVSTDGRTVAFQATPLGAGPAETKVYLRSADQLEAIPLPDTRALRPLDFSPDGEWLLVTDQGVLKRVALDGSGMTTITEHQSIGADWGPDDTVVHGSDEGLFLVPAAAGEPRQLTTVAGDEAGHYSPTFLPNNRAVLFHIWDGSPDTSQVAVYDFGTDESKSLVQGLSPQFSHSGHLVFLREGSLWAAPFDSDALEVVDDPRPVVAAVGRTAGGRAALYSLAADGTLVYLPSGGGETPRRLVWVDRRGREELIPAEPRPYGSVQLSPSGRQVAVNVLDGPPNEDIWIYDLVRRLPTRFTFHPGLDLWPLWTPAGERLVFTSTRDGEANLYWKAADGTGQIERLTTESNLQTPYSFAPDGRRLLFVQVGSPETGIDIGVVKMDEERQTEMLLQTEAVESHPHVSPDGRWLAYTSDESGQREVYVRPYPNVDDGRWQVSRGVGTSPRWGPDSRELFYQTQESVGAVTMMAVANETNPTFAPGNPVPLFQGPYRFGIGSALHSFDVSSEGRFLMIKEDSAASGQREIIVVQNWHEELKRLVPVD